MSNLSIFNFNDNQVRTILIGGEPWFVASDITSILELTNTTMAVQSLDDDEYRVIGRGEMASLTLSSTEGQKGGAQSMTLVNESGLYSLVMRSRKPEAKAFRKWVTSEVLPSIRKIEVVNPVTNDKEDLIADFHLL